MNSHRRTFIETSINLMVGFALSWTITFLALPLWGLHPTLGDSFGVTILFTVISFIRMYAIRRFFIWRWK